MLAVEKYAFKKSLKKRVSKIGSKHVTSDERREVCKSFDEAFRGYWYNSSYQTRCEERDVYEQECFRLKSVENYLIGKLSEECEEKMELKEKVEKQEAEIKALRAKLAQIAEITKQ